MEVRIKQGEEMIDATIEMVDGMMVVSPKEEKFEPKDGDVCTARGVIFIFKKNRASVDTSCETYILLNEGTLSFVQILFYESISPATGEDMQKLFSKMEEEGYAWDAEKKEVVVIQYMPERGMDYHTVKFNVFHLFQPEELVWDNDDLDRRRLEMGWVFPYTKEGREACNVLCEKLNEVIKL